MSNDERDDRPLDAAGHTSRVDPDDPGDLAPDVAEPSEEGAGHTEDASGGEGDPAGTPDLTHTVEADQDSPVPGTQEVTVQQGASVPLDTPATGPVIVQPNPVNDLIVDATNRAVRTFVQQLAIDVLVAVIVLLAPQVLGWQSLDDIQWKVIAFSVGKTIVATVFSFVMRRFMDKSSLPTPRPPVVSGDLTTPSVTGNVS